MRDFVHVGERQLHYRRVGAGAAVVALHDLGRSSSSLAAFAEQLAPSATVLAVDLPGHGLSDPPDGEMTVPGLAATVLAGLDELGVGRFALYGEGGGALVACELRALAGDRVTSAVLRNLPVLDAAARAELLAEGAVPIEPVWDGSHLTALWGRTRDRYWFAPWFRRQARTRRRVDLPPAEALHEEVMEQLRLPDAVAPVRALARYELPAAGPGGSAASAASAAPSLVYGAQDSYLGCAEPAADRLATTAQVLADAEVATRVAELLASPGANPADEPPPAPAAGAQAGRITYRYATTSHGQLFVRAAGDPGSGPPLVMLHASPTSAKFLEPLALELGRTRPVLAFDTLGNGESDKPSFREGSSGTYAEIVAEALDDVGIGSFDLYGSHTGATIAIELAIARRAQVRNLVLDGVPMFPPDETVDRLAGHCPPIELRSDGTHLLAAWTQVLHRMLYHHWYRPAAEEIKDVEPPDPREVHRWFGELIRSGVSYHIAYRAAFNYPTAQRLPLVDCRTLVCAVPQDVLAPYSEQAVALLGGKGEVATLPAQPEQAAATIAAFLGDGATR